MNASYPTEPDQTNSRPAPAGDQPPQPHSILRQSLVGLTNKNPNHSNTTINVTNPNNTLNAQEKTQTEVKPPSHIQKTQPESKDGQVGQPIVKTAVDSPNGGSNSETVTKSGLTSPTYKVGSGLAAIKNHQPPKTPPMPDMVGGGITPPPPITQVGPATNNSSEPSANVGTPPGGKKKTSASKSLKLVASAALMLVVVVGSSAAYYLSKQSQDVRQQAAAPPTATPSPTPKQGFDSNGVDIYCGKTCDKNYEPCAYSYPDSTDKYMCWNGVCQLTVCRGQECTCNPEKVDEALDTNYWKWDESQQACVPAAPNEKPSYKNKDKCEEANKGELQPVCTTPSGDPGVMVQPPDPRLNTAASISCIGTPNMLTTLEIATPADRGSGFNAFSRLLTDSSETNSAKFTFYKSGTHKIKCTLTNPNNRDKSCSVEKEITIPTPAATIPAECGNPCPEGVGPYEACVPGKPASEYMCWNGICQAAVCRGQDCTCDLQATPNEYWVWDQNLNNGQGGCKKAHPSTQNSFRIKENCEKAGPSGLLETPECKAVNVWPEPVYQGTSTISCMGTPNANYQILKRVKPGNSENWGNWEVIHDGKNSATTISFDREGEYQFRCKIYYKSEDLNG